MMAGAGGCDVWPGIGTLALTLTIVASGIAAATGTVSAKAPDVTVTAAFLYNFAKFAEWPVLLHGAPLVMCVVGEDRVAAALVETVRGQKIDGHPLQVRRGQDSAKWSVCHELFIAEAETGRSADRLSEIKVLPVLTVSDGKGFATGLGMIELYVEGGRMRFAINPKAAERSGLRLSSRLLGLAKVIGGT